jgi:hypothetical protein
MASADGMLHEGAPAASRARYPNVVILLRVRKLLPGSLVPKVVSARDGAARAHTGSFCSHGDTVEPRGVAGVGQVKS